MIHLKYLCKESRDSPPVPSSTDIYDSWGILPFTKASALCPNFLAYSSYLHEHFQRKAYILPCHQKGEFSQLLLGWGAFFDGSWKPRANLWFGASDWCVLLQIRGVVAFRRSLWMEVKNGVHRRPANRGWYGKENQSLPPLVSASYSWSTISFLPEGAGYDESINRQMVLLIPQPSIPIFKAHSLSGHSGNTADKALPFPQGAYSLFEGGTIVIGENCRAGGVLQDYLVQISSLNKCGNWGLGKQSETIMAGQNSIRASIFWSRVLFIMSSGSL